MSFIPNIDFFFVGIAICAIGILGFVVFFNRRQSVTNQTFLFFAMATIAYGLFNYLNYNVRSSQIVLLFLRLTLFSALWHAFTFFQLFFVFPKEKVKFSRWYTYLVVPLLFGVSFLTLTPLVFARIEQLAVSGQVTNPIRGPGMPVFGIVTIGFVAAGLCMLLKKLRAAEGKERIQYRVILAGSAISFSLIIVFNLLLPVLWNIVTFVPFALMFFFPFIACMAYAIIRHKFFDTKVIATEILVFFLSVAILFETLSATTLSSLFLRGIIFFLVLGIGILLIWSVRKEVQQRERVTELAKSLEQANSRLKELDQQKTDFLSIASHQLRTPLSIIKGYLELLHDGAYGRPTAQMIGIYDNLDQTNERLVKLVDDFLDVTRIEQGRVNFTFQPAQMKEIAESVTAELAKKAETKGVALSWEAKGAIPAISMDADKIRHVMLNFADNALKYTPRGSVRIEIGVKDGGVSVCVRDMGVGFGKKDGNHFFEKFYRGENVKGLKVDGAGIGLYVCKKFVEAHGGRVWCHSVGIGKGSEFGFWIPPHPPGA